MATFIPPMLANPVQIDKVQKYLDKGYWAEPKLDGIRCIAVKNGDDIRLYSRTGHSLSFQVPHIMFELAKWRNENVVLDGELGYYMQDPQHKHPPLPILDFNRTTRVTGSQANEAHRKISENLALDGEQIHYHVFDILNDEPSGWNHIGHKQLDATDQAFRRAYLEGTFDWNRHTELFIHMTSKITHHILEAYEMYVQAGGEGFMIKNPFAAYTSGRHANTWYKLKKFDSVDVVITGFTKGQGKYEGQIGAIEFGLYEIGDVSPTLLGKCSGMTDELRAMLTSLGDEAIGEVFEMRYFGKTAGSPRFPQFLRFRDDKAPFQCTMDTFE